MGEKKNMKDHAAEISLIMILSSVMLYGLLATNVVMHENAHKQIYEQNGIKARVVFYNHYMSGYTEANVTEESYRKVVHYHLLNEIIGYNMIVVSLSILLGFLLLSFTLWVIR